VASPQRTQSGAVRKHSVVLAGHATSLSLEAAFWDALVELARRRRCSLNRLIETIDRERTAEGPRVNLSSAVRLCVLAAARRGEL